MLWAMVGLLLGLTRSNHPELFWYKGSKGFISEHEASRICINRTSNWSSIHSLSTAMRKPQQDATNCTLVASTLLPCIAAVALHLSHPAGNRIKTVVVPHNRSHSTTLSHHHDQALLSGLLRGKHYSDKVASNFN